MDALIQPGGGLFGRRNASDSRYRRRRLSAYPGGNSQDVCCADLID
jgi:hypothetical protein